MSARKLIHPEEQQVSFVMPKTMHGKVRALARMHNMSLNNMFVKITDFYLKEKEIDSKLRICDYVAQEGGENA